MSRPFFYTRTALPAAENVLAIIPLHYAGGAPSCFSTE